MTTSGQYMCQPQAKSDFSSDDELRSDKSSVRAIRFSLAPNCPGRHHDLSLRYGHLCQLCERLDQRLDTTEAAAWEGTKPHASVVVGQDHMPSPRRATANSTIPSLVLDHTALFDFQCNSYLPTFPMSVTGTSSFFRAMIVPSDGRERGGLGAQLLPPIENIAEIDKKCMFFPCNKTLFNLISLQGCSGVLLASRFVFLCFRSKKCSALSPASYRCVEEVR